MFRDWVLAACDLFFGARRPWRDLELEAEARRQAIVAFHMRHAERIWTARDQAWATLSPAEREFLHGSHSGGR
ncbi:hypothetical protein [Methylobacterium iners]|uniref:Uncharacterized protein n=1 Tax=Methylobacterium iners TaxID=418707 RepID=A0ABQ4RRT2_9HYPH|nr:hypothetical protein [Methylobacterium iners]GJD92914.1 hypothetical protein OCOJLMKI_0097 [Methylobacterium iners]